MPRERGGAAVELAIVLPVVVALLCGIVDFGMVLNDYQSIRAGVRDGAREAVVGEFDSACTAGTPGQKLICSVKAHTLIDTTDLRVRVEVASGGGAVGDQVVVCAAEPMTSISGVYAPVMSGSILKAQTAMRVKV